MFIEWIQRIQQPLITIHIPCVHYHTLCECRSSLALCMASLMYNSLLHELLKKITQDFAFSCCEKFIHSQKHNLYNILNCFKLKIMLILELFIKSYFIRNYMYLIHCTQTTQNDGLKFQIFMHSTWSVKWWKQVMKNHIIYCLFSLKENKISQIHVWESYQRIPWPHYILSTL